MTNKIMYFIANWKMYGNLKSLNTLDKVIKFSKSKEIKKGRLIYCPPYTLISSFLKKFENCLIDIGGQNCHESEDYGSHTGFVNSKMLKSSGANYVILGHSENRQNGEDNKLINQKIKSSLKSGLKVIFCIGETLREKNNNQTKIVLSRQINNCLKGIKNYKKIIIAYEPIWAIGTGKIPKLDDLRKNILFVRKRFRNKSMKVLYGGSVNNKNIKDLKKISTIDGFLIGGESRDPKKFIDIIKKTYN